MLIWDLNLFSSLILLTNVQLLPDVLVRDHQRNKERKIERERERFMIRNWLTYGD